MFVSVSHFILLLFLSKPGELFKTVGKKKSVAHLYKQGEL